MKLRFATAAVLFAIVMIALPASAGKKNKAKPAGEKLVDEGSFGVYVNGGRVATEKFAIKQTSDSSLSSSELRLGDGEVAQTSELRMLTNGNLIRYEWKSLAEKVSTVLEPQGDFLIERYTGTDGKVGEQPFLMPVSTPVLDDFFFSHRQLLLWRYLGANCQMEQDKGGCPLTKAQFGTVIPRQHISSMVSVEYVGLEKVRMPGGEQQLSHFRFTTEGPAWSLWIDGSFKVQRILIPETNTEILRE